MEIFRPARLSSLDSLVQQLDSIRVLILHWTLKSDFLRSIYGKTYLRLSLGMILSTIFALPFAVLRPDLLLAMGPLLFGYPHLVASYRFSFFKSFKLFIIVTLIAIGVHLSKVGFFHIEQLPFGVWQIVVAAGALLVSQFLSKVVRPLQLVVCLLLTTLLIQLAWQEPLIYVGATLILHNWVAFFYWIMVARDKRRRMTAIASSFLFLIIHLLVLNGNLDSWIPENNGQIQFGGDSQTTAWYLASWSQDPIVWYRLLILYTFGLSMHYFVWLRAIPESLNKFEHPNNFRIILKNLRQDLGVKALLFTLLIALSGLIIWLFSFPLGSAIYFEMAILHGSLELIFLIPKTRLNRLSLRH